jgi:hypothetical protein
VSRTLTQNAKQDADVDENGLEFPNVSVLEHDESHRHRDKEHNHVDVEVDVAVDLGLGVAAVAHICSLWSALL